MALYLIANGPMPTTAAQAAVATGTSIKTLLQIKPFNTCRIVEWGISTSIPASAGTLVAELLDTGTVFATVTASADADVAKLGSVEDAVASVVGLTLATSGTGYTASAEGSITAVRMFDPQQLSMSTSNGAQYVKQYPLGREPKCIIGNSVRVRVTSTVTVNANCYMILEF